MVNRENSPVITFEYANPPIGGLRIWPQIRHNPTNKPEHIRKLNNLKAGIKKNSNTPTKPQQQRASLENSYKRQEAQEQTSIYKHTQNPHTDPDVMHMKWHGDHMSTDAKRNTTHREQCSAPNVTNLSPTHTS